ncbi:hypothetical protein PQ627_13915, partial [Paenarthrobacter sp. AB444]|nr:hypothetical protein [Paenarthrobacter sp. AB444]
MTDSPALQPPNDGRAGHSPLALPDDSRILPRLGDTDASSVAPGGSAPEVGAFLDDAVEALAGLRGAAVADARLFGFVEAADFAGRVEDLARTLEYVQIIAAQAVERTRNQEQQAQRSQAQTRQVSAAATPEKSGIPWLTGWAEPAETAERATDSATESAIAPGPGAVVGSGLGAGAGAGLAADLPRAGTSPSAGASAGSVLDDGY